MINKKVIFCLTALMIIAVGCRKKDSKDNGVTGPDVSSTKTFKSLVANKTFTLEGKEIKFNENSFPLEILMNEGIHEKDEDGNEITDDDGTVITLEVKTSLLSSDNTRAVYEQSITAKNKNTGLLVGEQKGYYGYEIKDNGGLLYKTEAPKMKVEDIKWEEAKLSGALKSRTLALTGNWTDIAKREGYYISKTMDNGIFFGMKIGVNAGEIFTAFAGRIDNVKNNLQRDKTYGNNVVIGAPDYERKDISKSYMYRNNNRFIVVLHIDTSDPAPDNVIYRVYDITYNSDGTITMVDNNTGTSLVLEKYNPEI